MKLFKVAKGTEVKVIKGGVEWYSGNFVTHTTKNENIFELEQIVIDPVGKQGPNKHGVTVGGAWANAGWYGFEQGGFILMATIHQVEVL